MVILPGLLPPCRCWWPIGWKPEEKPSGIIYRVPTSRTTIQLSFRYEGRSWIGLADTFLLHCSIPLAVSTFLYFFFFIHTESPLDTLLYSFRLFLSVSLCSIPLKRLLPFFFYVSSDDTSAHSFFRIYDPQFSAFILYMVYLYPRAFIPIRHTTDFSLFLLFHLSIFFRESTLCSVVCSFSFLLLEASLIIYRYCSFLYTLTLFRPWKTAYVLQHEINH